MDLVNSLKKLLEAKPEWENPDNAGMISYINSFEAWRDQVIKETKSLIQDYEELEFRMKGLDK